MVRQRARPQFRSDRAGPELGVGQVEVILPLEHMIGKLIADSESQPPWPPVGTNDIEPDDLRFLAAVEGISGKRQIPARPDHYRAVALVEPFRLHARAAAPGFSAFQ